VKAIDFAAGRIQRRDFVTRYIVVEQAESCGVTDSTIVGKGRHPRLHGLLHDEPIKFIINQAEGGNADRKRTCVPKCEGE
jgi:hypothetical protein